jgi:hypothetical protein
MMAPVWARRTVAVLSVALVCGLAMVGSSVARPGDQVAGITIKAPLKVVEHNVGLWGFFTKPGVACTDFTGAGASNPAVKFGALDVLSHPENGRAGCLVQAETIEFLRAGTIHFQISLTETGAFTGTDTINDTAIVTTSVAQQAETLIRSAMVEEAAAYAALQRFKKTKNVGELRSAATHADDADSELTKAGHLPLPGSNGKQALSDIHTAAIEDAFAKLYARAVSKDPRGPDAKSHLKVAETVLAKADRLKESALKLLG